MKTRTLILLIVMLICFVAAACVSKEPQDTDVEYIEMKFPISVDDARKKAKGAVEKAKGAVEFEFVELANENSKAKIEVATAVVMPDPVEPQEEQETGESDENSVLKAVEEILAVEDPAAVEEVAEETVWQEEVVYEETGYYDTETGDEMPIPAEEFGGYGHSYLGCYSVTWYSQEEVGYDAPGASGLGLVPGYTCAMPDYGLLGCTVLVSGYGYYLVTDVSPAGIVDLFVSSNAEIPAYGVGVADVYIVG